MSKRMNNEQELRPGAMLRNDSYRIECVLGQGGFGITYLATDLNLERKVAIKEFFPKDYCGRDGSTSHVTLGTQSASEFVERLKTKFLKEARNIAKFDHPGIIKIHAAFEENNTAYYVMEYIEGESLSEMVKRNGPLSPEHAVRYMEKVGDALEYVHKHKINHLDIKPANIMVRRSDDCPLLIDFGLSKQYDQSGNQTSTTPTGISHGYAPMEQYSSGGVREFSPQTDIYSLAASLYYILTGIVPPQAITMVEEPLTFPDSVPAALRTPIAKAMSPVRRMRHETVKEFIGEISGKSKSDNSRISVPKADEATVITPPINVSPAPTSTTVPIINPEPVSVETPTPKSGSKKKLMIIIGSAVIACALILLIFFIGGNESSERTPDEDLEDSLTVAEDKIWELIWESPLGTASYSGEVLSDSSDMRPNGYGTAKITDGQYKGNVYTGNFKDGKMEGPATYTLSNGDKFEGTFKDNEYLEGRYTIKSTGEYFVGTFKGGNPDKGNWYNSRGEKI